MTFRLLNILEEILIELMLFEFYERISSDNFLFRVYAFIEKLSEHNFV